MSKLNSKTTSDYVEWDEMLSLIRNLFNDGQYRLSLLIGCGSFFGLRISDLLTLRWSMLLGVDRFELVEKKTGKHRTVKINREFQKHIASCRAALNINDVNELCFVSRKHQVYSVQRINVIFKDIKQRYGVNAEHFSTHSMRKTFGRRVVEQAGDRSEMALIMLSELFNHSSPQITRRYLGLRDDELLSVYDNLKF